MKKIFIIIFVISVLSGCNSSTLSFSKIENVPNNVQDKIDTNLRLQSINVDGKGYYIVFHSKGDVEAVVETQGDTVTIILNETSLQENGVKQNTYYLTTDPEHDVIDVLVNGESASFDGVTVQ